MMDNAQQQIFSTAFPLVLATHPNGLISLMSSPPFFILEEMSNAMSNSSDSIMLCYDWLQIRSTAHISTQVIIWISASRW